MSHVEKMENAKEKMKCEERWKMERGLYLFEQGVKIKDQQ